MIRKKGKDRSALCPGQKLSLPQGSCSGEGEPILSEQSQAPIPGTIPVPGLLTTCSAALWGPRWRRARPKASLLALPGCSEQRTAAMGTTMRSGLLYLPAKLEHLNPCEFFKAEALDSEVQKEQGF